MRRQTLLYIILGCLCLLTSCGNDDYTPSASELRVVKSDVDFPATGGNGQITVTSGAAVTSVVSSDSWCHVALADANNANVTVESNIGSDSRHAVVTFRDADGGEAHVAVSQEGMQFMLDDDKSFLLNDGVGKGAVKITKHTFDVSVSTGDYSWISARVDGDSVRFTTEENNTGLCRGGYIHCHCGSRTDTILVLQAEKKDIYGDYEVIGDPLPDYDESVITTHFKMTLAPSDEDGKVKIVFPEYNANLSFDVNFNDADLEFNYPAGLSLGTMYHRGMALQGIVNCHTRVMGVNSQGDAVYDYTDGLHSMTAYMTFENGQFLWRFKDNHSWAGITISAIGIEATQDGNNQDDIIAHADHPYMVRL